MAASTFFLYSSRTVIPLITLETVPSETPASLATSFIVGAFVFVIKILLKQDINE